MWVLPPKSSEGLKIIVIYFCEHDQPHFLSFWAKNICSYLHIVAFKKIHFVSYVWPAAFDPIHQIVTRLKSELEPTKEGFYFVSSFEKDKMLPLEVHYCYSKYFRRLVNQTFP